MKKILQRFAVWLAKRLGVVLVARPTEAYLAAAREFTQHVNDSNEPWEWKHRQCIRAMLNRFPNSRVRDLNLAIEIAVQECSADR